MDLYIFRHGETYFSKNDLPYGKMVRTAEILPEGIPIIEKLANHLKNIPTDKNCRSPFKRCRQTTKIVTDITGKKFDEDARLRDIVYKEEDSQEMIERVVEFAKEIETQNFQSVSICTHGYPINALITYFSKGIVTIADLENFPQPGVLVVIKDKKVKYINFN